MVSAPPAGGTSAPVGIREPDIAACMALYRFGAGGEHGGIVKSTALSAAGPAIDQLTYG
jgi:hypothetical protein